MTYNHCRGRMRHSKAPCQVDWNGYLLRFNAVPVWVCDQCGEAYFEEREIGAVQSAIDVLDHRARQFAAGA